MARDIACAIPSEFLVSTAREANSLVRKADMARSPEAFARRNIRRAWEMEGDSVRPFVDATAYRIGPNGERIPLPRKAKARKAHKSETAKSVQWIIAAPQVQPILRDWKAEVKSRLAHAIRQGQE